MLKPGTYKLARDVANPEPDRRYKEDWRYQPEWKAGAEFLVQPSLYKERDDEPTEMWTRIVKVGYRWTHDYLTMADAARYQALEAALVPCEMSDRAFFTEHGVSDYFARWLIESGRLSRELFLKLTAEQEADGELKASDPYPQRPPLVEAEAPRIDGYRLDTPEESIEFLATEREAFTRAVSLLKGGAPSVAVHCNGTQIADLSVAARVPLPTPDPRARRAGLREMFKRLDAALDEASSAVHGLRNEITALVMEHEAAAVATIERVLVDNGIGTSDDGTQKIAREIVAALGGTS